LPGDLNELGDAQVGNQHEFRMSFPEPLDTGISVGCIDLPALGSHTEDPTSFRRMASKSFIDLIGSRMTGCHSCDEKRSGDPDPENLRTEINRLQIQIRKRVVLQSDTLQSRPHRGATLGEKSDAEMIRFAMNETGICHGEVLRGF
jgi:hypothetical protein